MKKRDYQGQAALIDFLDSEAVEVVGVVRGIPLRPKVVLPAPEPTPDAEMTDTIDEVYRLLEENEENRNSDKRLIFNYLKANLPGFARACVFEEFEKLPQLPTIKRLRAIIQNDRLELLPTDIKVLELRARRSANIKKFLEEQEAA